ncbi:dihydroorotase [Marinilactibacillus kalidii]|uniref:dihydroorotase n=1 Tax=Marinilactibacillus kalidii TaxID=2820274 RepID=UPI001ABEB9B5|nr:dihydroorotase [Marinilactibacillus kalidii]
MKIVIKHATILSEEGKTKDILIDEGKIQSIEDDLSSDDAHIIDVEGKLVVPGLIDVHVHLREPGFEYKETIATGTAAAAKGGFTTICAMPNVNPTPDTAVKMRQIQTLIKKDALVKVKQYAPITELLTTDQLTDQESLIEAGAFAFTNDGVGVQTAATMYKAMEQAVKNNKPIVAHTEDDSLLFDGGAMHEGIRNKALGLPGMTQLTESTQIARDVLLAEATGAHYHICHVSAKESVRVIRDAKRAGIKVTAEVTPHHLLLSEMDIPSDDALFKMNPPLRGKEDQAALLEGLLDGTIDMIATDHAPHSDKEKSGSMLGASFGIIGSETAFPLLYTHLVKTNKVTLKQLVDWMTVKPAEVFNLTEGRLTVGAPADLACFNLEAEKVIDEQYIHSKSSNTPFMGWNVYGNTYITIVDGNVVYQEEK